MDKYYIVIDDGLNFIKVAEESDYYDSIIRASACYLAYHEPIRVIHNGKIIHRIDH